MFPDHTKFLVVDDTKTIRVLLKEILGNLGYRDVHEAEDGNQALQMLKDHAQAKKPFTFIICDWNMPGLTGLDLLEFRNADQRFKNVPFLMITIESERDYVLRAVAMGVSDYVVKPFSENTIKAKMQGIWNRLQRGS
jgi:two-component system, chemotaxis family, chemotaxis protein CheY